MSWRSLAARLALAMAFVGVALALTLFLEQIAERAYFFLFFPAIMFSAWYGGASAGLLASALTVVLAGFYVVPRDSIDIELPWLITAAIVAFITSAVTTARVRAEDRLSAVATEERLRRVDAESQSQIKTDLLAQVAHELRQPLNAMTVATRLVESSPEAVARGVQVIRRQTDHLRHLVDDLLDLSRLTRRDLVLQKTMVDLCEVVEDTTHVIAQDLQERGITFSSSVPSCPLTIEADATRLRQVISNLLSNAVKFTPAGGEVHLSVEQTSTEVTLRVRDTGDGIAPERIAHIFEMFQKGDRRGNGLGVGLAVVKGLVTVHGGTVEARSAGVGQGSEFIVRLPIAARESAA